MNDSISKITRVLPAAGPVLGGLCVPGSKSIGNRAILLAACAQGTSNLRGVLDSDDTRAALRALTALGVPGEIDGDTVVVTGAPGFSRLDGDIDIGSSGTVGRFLPGLLAAAPRGDWRLVSTGQLARRPLAPLLDALRHWGGRLEQPESGASFPLRVTGGGMRGGEVSVSAKQSSQFASGLLLAAPLCQSPSVVVIRDLDPDECYIDMTLDLMRLFGVELSLRSENDVATVSFSAPQAYRSADLTIEADANTANYFLALAALTGGTVSIGNLRSASRQPGVKFLDVFERLGCAVGRGDSVSVTGPSLPLRGGFSIDMRAMSEMALTLGVMTAFADQPVSMTNLAHIRGHESDRISALAGILRQLGVRTEEEADAVTVYPADTKRLPDIVVDPLDDHRIAMAFAVLGAAASGIGIKNADCVAKTCPMFFSLLGRMGIRTL